MKSEVIKTGDRFKKWCEIMGRNAPTDDVVDLLNTNMDAGARKIKEYLPTKPDMYRNYCSFLGGKGHGRV